ncbi:MAG: hypothetical protein WB567_19295, partial [Terracidiphilus sp.]
ATNRLAEAEPPMRSIVEIFLTFTRATSDEHPNLQVAISSYAAVLEDMVLGPIDRYQGIVFP